MQGPQPRSMTWPAKVAANLGLTLQECAAWLGVDRRALGRLVEEVPFGRPAATVSPGRIPARRVGGRWVVIPGDLLGSTTGDTPTGHAAAPKPPLAPPRAAGSTASPDSFRSELAALRRAGRRAASLGDEQPGSARGPRRPSCGTTE